MKRRLIAVFCSVGALACLGGEVVPPPGPVRNVDYASVSMGDLHVCALATDGTGLCWGDNITGQLGTDDVDTRLQPDFIVTSLKFDKLLLGALHTCGMIGTRPWCWGANNVGQLGTGSITFPIGIPDTMFGGLRFIDYSVGAIHTCGVSTDTLSYCWGSAERGQLGEGTSGNLTFKAIAELVITDSTFVQIEAGGAHTCALTEVGQAWCWGANTFGQLGTGGFLGTAFPALVTGEHQFQSLALGGVHTCGMTMTGDAYCWGEGTNAQLGHGGTGNKADPELVQGGHTWRAVSAGGTHTCGVTTTDDVLCWGINDSGQLGNGTTDLSLMPAPITGSVVQFETVQAGSGSIGAHTCGRATSGDIYCWGRGTEGQVGHGLREERVLVPTLVLGQS